MDISRQEHASEESADDTLDVEKATDLAPLPEPRDVENNLNRIVTARDWTGPDDPENPHNWPLWQRVYHR